MKIPQKEVADERAKDVVPPEVSATDEPGSAGQVIGSPIFVGLFVGTDVGVLVGRAVGCIIRKNNFHEKYE